MALSTSTVARWTILSSSVGLPMGRWRPSAFGMETRSTGEAIRAPLQAVCQLPKVGFELLSVGGPCLAIHSRSCIVIEAVIGLPQSVDGVDMLPQRSQPYGAIPCCLAYPVQRT